MTHPPLHIEIHQLPNCPNAALPSYQTEGSSGMDLCAALVDSVVITPGQVVAVPCGIAIAVPHGYEAQVRPRSGLALNHGVTVLNSPGTIDADYRGEIKVLLANLGAKPFTLSPGDRVAQLVVAPVVHVIWQRVEHLPTTLRGTGGFGHTGT